MEKLALCVIKSITKTTQSIIYFVQKVSYRILSLAKAKRIKIQADMIGLSFQTQEEFVEIKAKVLREDSPHVEDDTSVQLCF